MKEQKLPDYLPCPRCRIDEGMGLTYYPDGSRRLAVWCCICEFFGPGIPSRAPSRAVDLAAIQAWNDMPRNPRQFLIVYKVRPVNLGKKNSLWRLHRFDGISFRQSPLGTWKECMQLLRDLHPRAKLRLDSMLTWTASIAKAEGNSIENQIRM